ncbi:MAG: hypothetical protein RL456_3432 [Pseudomonadota bacterium]|jgi:EAL domain-containing protein (putative c-di-GMP-specific phosphodiesterase class I)
MQPLRIVVVEDGPLLVDDHDTTLRHMGLIDGRTGLPHRDLLLDRLGQAAAGVARGGSAFALVVIGLGAAEGPGDLDESAVEAFASRLHSLGRRTDSYARIAPDAFAGLLSGNPSVAGVMAMGQKFAAEFQGRLQVRIGVALCPRHASEPETLLAQARAAMEQARAAQTTTAIYEPRPGAMAHAAQGAGHPRPAERPDAPGRLLFQPVIDLRGGTLLRLQIVTPRLAQARADFAPTRHGGAIPPAGRTELADALVGTLDEALRAATAWRQQGRVQRLSLPLPGRLLDAPDLADRLLGTLDRHRWPAAHCLFEAHAAALAQRGGRVAEALIGGGAPLALHDGGSGLSLHLALAGIEPVAEFRIDAAALQTLPRTEQRAGVVRAMLALARGWGARLVAEGVDDLATLAWLGELGCDAAQGLACGRPMPAEQVPPWCDGRQRPAGEPARPAARQGQP